MKRKHEEHEGEELGQRTPCLIIRVSPRLGAFETWRTNKKWQETTLSLPNTPWERVHGFSPLNIFPFTTFQWQVVVCYVSLHHDSPQHNGNRPGAKLKLCHLAFFGGNYGIIFRWIPPLPLKQDDNFCSIHGTTSFINLEMVPILGKVRLQNRDELNY